MTETTNGIIKCIVLDTIIITTILGILHDDRDKYFFGLGMSIYILTKYI
jgi:hypothetical protein